MRAFIQSLAGVRLNAQAEVAAQGFRALGVECVSFLDREELEGIERGDVLMGSDFLVRWRLIELGAVRPDLCYPAELAPFFGRTIRKMRAKDIDGAALPLFVRPAARQSFRPVAAFGLDDLAECGVTGEVWVSEVVWMRSVWRTFVRHGSIVATLPAEGDMQVVPDGEVIERAVSAWESAPAGGALDFGVTEEGATILVRARDGVLLPPLGLEPRSYALLVAAAWSELVGVEDPLAGVEV